MNKIGLTFLFLLLTTIALEIGVLIAVVAKGLRVEIEALWGKRVIGRWNKQNELE